MIFVTIKLVSVGNESNDTDTRFGPRNNHDRLRHNQQANDSGGKYAKHNNLLISHFCVARNLFPFEQLIGAITTYFVIIMGSKK